MKDKSRNDILLTISVAAYNVEKYIGKTLESCIVPEEYQKEMEVIIVNDGSTDHTYQIAMQYEKKYPHLFKVINKKNGGYGSTINTSIKIANGKYFKLLDGDDWFDRDTLVNFLDKIKECDSDVLFMKYRRVDSNNKKTKVVGYGNIEEHIIYNFVTEEKKLNWTMHGIAVKTDVLTNNEIKITENCFYTDTEYVLLIMKYMRTYECFNLVLYQYRVGNNGQSVSRQGIIKHKADARKTLMTLLKIYDDVKIESLKQEMNRYIATSARFAINGYALCGWKEKNKRDIVELDMWIKENYYQIYRAMNRGMSLCLFRKMGYHFYLLFWLDALRKFI